MPVGYGEQIYIKKYEGPKIFIVMTLQRISPSGIKYAHVYQVTDKDQFLTRPFNELWDYLASAPLRDTAKTKMGQEAFESKNKQYS
jgi:hypothetical protein